MNKLLCVPFACINLRNKKDETGDSIDPSFCANYWLRMQKDFKFFKHLSEIAEHCKGTNLGFSMLLKKKLLVLQCSFNNEKEAKNYLQ